MTKDDQARPSHLLRYGSLALLVLQNALLVNVIKLARKSPGEDGLHFLSVTAVAMTEALKILLSVVLQIVHDGSVTAAMQTFREELPTIETLKVGVPGVLYCIQTNLLYVALSNLSVPMYQVTSQIKILTTAFFSMTMLGKRLSCLQGLALVLLGAGVAIVQLSLSNNHETERTDANYPLGLASILAASMTSGFAGVYFEKMLKQDRPVTLYVRNVQLSSFGVVIALATVAVSAGNAVKTDGFFQGYSHLVWFMILVQAGGGLLVAAVIKLTDNILKSFAAAASIIVGSVASVAIFGTHLSPLFDLGGVLVMVATFVYSRYPARAEPANSLNEAVEDEDEVLELVPNAEDKVGDKDGNDNLGDSADGSGKNVHMV